MAFEVDDEEQTGSSLPGVSGSVVHALVALIRDESGDSGVAHALALAAEDRSFTVLADTRRWMPLDEAVALFAAGALVTGEGAIALRVGGDLLWTDEGAGLAGRIRSLDSPETAFRHVGALVACFEGATDAVALEVSSGRALVQVSRMDGGSRHPHLCELTRGLLRELPALFGREPAWVIEHECAARGGRACHYELEWSDRADNDVSPAAEADQAGRTVGRKTGGSEWSEYVIEQPTQQPLSERVRINRSGEHGSVNSNGNGTGHDHGSSVDDRPGIARADVEVLAEQLTAARAALVETAAEAARWEAEAERGRVDNDEAHVRERVESAAESVRSRQEVARLEQLLEGTTSMMPGLHEHDLGSVLAELADRADQMITADRYLLMVRAGSGLPIELHHRGLDEGEAGAVAARLWSDGVDGSSDRMWQVVDIASPRRRYGRLAVSVDPSQPEPTDQRVLHLFARYAANVLDVFTVLDNVRRSDSTSRTILSFSEMLSGLTNLTQALQILADTVPEVTSCTQSTIYLWDREESRLVLGAFTTGMAAPDADLGPITPHWAASGSDARTQRTDDGAQGDTSPLSFEADNPLFQQLAAGRGVMVLDSSTVGDPLLRTLMEESDVPASVIAPLFAAGNFLGVIAANFSGDAAGAVHDLDLHERLAGLADQAAVAIQNLELLEKVSHMAWHDALTGLPNRRLFEDRVEQELVRSRRVGEPVCMFFVDLDNFKTVNDTFGHATGDVLIQQVGQRLVDTVRSQDTVARVGGDEFAILLPGLVDQLSINQLAERTLDAVHTPFDIFGEPVTTSASIGIAIAPEHGDTYDDLLNRADEAMYRAKDLGRNAFEMFHASPGRSHPGRRSLDDRQLHADLVSALDADEFFLVYQPYIDLRTAEVVGVEALIRWEHPTLGVLEPQLFIPMAEKSDLIVALDNWVLWQACRQLRSWQDHGIDQLRLSVNLASRDLSSPDFYENVARTLRDTGIEPSSLELEITERVVLDKSGPGVDNIERLRKLGVRFTIDNFGSGNSSLDRIGTFPVSTLKIDQSFVQVLGPADEESNLVGAIISMAGKLGLSCVAEGVETLQQSRVLLQRGCTTAQGYYFSPPLAPEGIEVMLDSLRPAEVPESFGEPPSEPTPPDHPTM